MSHFACRIQMIWNTFHKSWGVQRSRHCFSSIIERLKFEIMPCSPLEDKNQFCIFTEQIFDTNMTGVYVLKYHYRRTVIFLNHWSLRLNGSWEEFIFCPERTGSFLCSEILTTELSRIKFSELATFFYFSPEGHRENHSVCVLYKCGLAC